GSAESHAHKARHFGDAHDGGTDTKDLCMASTSPFNTIELSQAGSTRVEDTTYLGTLFKLSAHSPLPDDHRAPKRSSLRRPKYTASAPSASANSPSAHASRSLSRNSSNQPPCLKRSSPVVSSTTPSSEMFSFTTIFPISVLLALS